MKKIFFIAISSLITTSIFAQDSTNHFSKKPSNLAGRANDHFLLQVGVTNWAGKTDSMHTKGLSRSFNMYFMFDLRFKSNPHLSAGIGVGIGTDNIYFDKTYIGIKDATGYLQFQDLSDTTHFKKYKLATAILEAPIELRYSAHPETPNKSFKLALGIKAGVLLNAHTKGKNWESSTGTALIAYTEKQTSKRFFNSNRFVATARIGYGVFGLFGTYQLNTLFKTGLGPDVRPYTIGLTLSGL
ncbi:MAG: outer membrane beta-barrel protein [Chitinophagales bacterium]